MNFTLSAFISSSAPIFLAVGWLLVILAICLIFPLGLALYCHESTLEHFAICFFLCLFIGGLFVLCFSYQKAFRLQVKEGFFLTIAAWVVVSLFSALPFYLSGMAFSFSDSLFESVSSLTTTGVSLLKKDHYSAESLRFWRIFLQWIGGFGIILMAVTLLPALKIGGAQLIMSEFSDRSEKIMPRAHQIATFLMGIYVGMTVLCILLLAIGGLSPADCFYYSMASISTGGIIVPDQPIAFLSGYCKGVITMAMIFGGSTLILLLSFLQDRGQTYLRDDQIQGYGKLLGGTILCTVLWNRFEAVPESVLAAVSAVTTTGFDLGTPYDGFLMTLFLIVSYIGGCSGSTGGGIKVFRVQILYRVTKNQILSMINPYGFFVTLYNRSPVDQRVLTSLLVIIFFYAAGWLVFSLLFTAFGYSFADAFPLSAGLITNSGLHSGPLLRDPHSIMMAEKYCMILGMLCGRFEFMTLFAVISTPFWKK
jgi:trk system potassium uptake protein TrkH